jgi:hypothetical protein
MLWSCNTLSCNSCCPADAFADEDPLVEFGSVASPQQAADIQARLEERRAAAAAASSSSSSSSFVPRKLRKKQLPIEALPKVAIVGRPNVGKSAMFNRLAGSSLAVVFDYPGVTRDRLYTRAFWGDKEFCLIDTGMWHLLLSSGLQEHLQRAAVVPVQHVSVFCDSHHALQDSRLKAAM